MFVVKKERGKEMKNIYDNKRIWKFYFMLLIFLMPLVVATVKLAGFNIIDTLVFVIFNLLGPYVIITLLIREVVLEEVDAKEIININEIKILRALNYLVVGIFIMSHTVNSMMILSGEHVTLSLLSLLIAWCLFLDAGLIITRNKIYYRNTIIERKEIVRVEGKSLNDIKVYLANGKDVRIRYKKIASYIEPFESKVR